MDTEAKEHSTEVPQALLDLAKDVLDGKNKAIWAKTIALPNEFQLKFPKSETDDETNASGKSITHRIHWLRVVIENVC